MSICQTVPPASHLAFVQNEAGLEVARIPGLQELWQQTLGDPRICIAVLDGPVDLTHPSLRQAAITQIDPDGVTPSGSASLSDHGTHVTSVIFGSHDGPVQGIAPHCRGLIIPIFRYAANGSLQPCSQQRLAQAIRTAVRFGANVINISGGQFSSRGEASSELLAAINECGDDALIVAAAGNDGCDCLHVPGALPSVLAVGAMDADGRPLAFSNWGAAYRERGVLAPGERILGAAGGGGVKVQSGTSFATPIVSGIAALLLSLQQGLGIVPSSKSVRNAILETTHGCDPQTEAECERMLAGRLSIGGSVTVVTRGANIMHNATNHFETAEVALSSTGAPVPSPEDSLESVGASACCEGCTGSSKQFVYAIGEVDYDFPSLSRLHSLQHSMSVLTSTNQQLQVQNKLDFARHLCGFREVRISVNTGGISSVGAAGKKGPYEGFIEFTMSNGNPFTPEDDGRCILVQGVLVSENGGPKKPWIYNDLPLRIGYIADNKFCILGVGYTAAQVFDFGKASWVLPQGCNSKEVRQHTAHRYDASSVVWKLKRGSTNFYAIEPARSFSEDAYDELTDFLLQSLGYGREGLDIYYYGWGGAVHIWPGDWDPCFNNRDCCFAAEPKLTQCCENYQNTTHDARYRFAVAPTRLPRNLPKAQRVAIPGSFGGESVLLNGEVLREIVPEMRGTLSWSLATLLDHILGEISPNATPQALTVRFNLMQGVLSLLQHFDRRLRNPGTAAADRALNYAATRLQDILADVAPELVTIDAATHQVKVFELDDILTPSPSQIGPPGSDCWEVEIAFFDPVNVHAARVIVAQTIDVSDVVPHLVEEPKKYRRR